MLRAGGYSAVEGSQSLDGETANPIGDLTDGFVQVSLGVTDYYAKKIVRTLGLPAVDLDDLRQDLLVEVLRRAGYYDRGRAGLTTFIELITRHAADELASRRISERRVVRRSIDEPIARADGSCVPLGHLLPEERGLAGLWAASPDPFAAVEDRIDVERFIQRLPDGLRRLCRLLQMEAPTVAQRLSGLSPAEFYRDVADLRMRLRSIGLGTP